MFRQIDGHQLFTVAFGSGPRTFVAHSGWIGTWEDWLPPLEILSHRWRAVAYDHRGTGEAQAPLDAISREALVDDVARVMDAAGVATCVLGGFSLGTAITLEAYFRHPERFTGLVLMNGAAGVLPPGLAPPPPGLPSRWPGADHSARMRWFMERCTPEPDVEHIRRWGHRILCRTGPKAADRLFTAMLGPGVPAERLAAIQVPTLIIHGAQDPFTAQAAMEYLAARIPHSKLVVLDGVGHLPALTRPQLIADAIDGFFA